MVVDDGNTLDERVAFWLSTRDENTATGKLIKDLNVARQLAVTPEVKKAISDMGKACRDFGYAEGSNGIDLTAARANMLKAHSNLLSLLTQRPKVQS